MSPSADCSPTSAVSPQAIWRRLDATDAVPTPDEAFQLGRCIYGQSESDLDHFDKLAIAPYLIKHLPSLPPETRATLVRTVGSYFTAQIELKRHEQDVKAPDAVVDLCAMVFAQPEPDGMELLYEKLNAEPRYCRAVYSAFHLQLAAIKAKAVDIPWSAKAKATLVDIARRIMHEVYGGPLSNVLPENDDDTIHSTSSGSVAGFLGLFLPYRTSQRLDPATTYYLNCQHSNYARKLALLDIVAIAHELSLDLSPPSPPRSRGFFAALFAPRHSSAAVGAGPNDTPSNTIA